MSDIEDCYTKKDMEAAFVAARLMYMDKVPFFDGFYEFFSWYKTTRNYEKVFQLQEKLPINNVQEEHKGIPKT